MYERPTIRDPTAIMRKSLLQNVVKYNHDELMMHGVQSVGVN